MKKEIDLGKTNDLIADQLTVILGNTQQLQTSADESSKKRLAAIEKAVTNLKAHLTYLMNGGE